jgi:NADH-quinone oxidoreductase subunit M
MNLNKLLPFAAVTFVIASVASMGLPGFSGFVAELQVLIGSWRAFPTLTVLAGLGVLVGVAYTLRVLQKAFFAEHPPEPVSPAHNGGPHDKLEAISVPERLGALFLVGVSLLIGLYPHLLLQWITPSLESPLFEGLRKGAGW